VLFHHKACPEIVSGRIGLTFRLWKRPHARLGGVYALPVGGAIEVTELSIVPACKASGSGR
jgi:hypothetical protein